MSKISFSKLNLKSLNDVKIVIFNGQEIEVKQYLPVGEKLALIMEVLNDSFDENRFANPVKVEVFTNLAILNHYTNITFSQKQKEEFIKVYDLAEENGLFEAIISEMNEGEYTRLLDYIQETLDFFYGYTNSIYGILENVTNDYKDLDLDVNTLIDKINNDSSLTLVKDIADKLD